MHIKEHETPQVGFQGMLTQIKEHEHRETVCRHSKDNFCMGFGGRLDPRQLCCASPLVRKHAALDILLQFPVSTGAMQS